MTKHKELDYTQLKSMVPMEYFEHLTDREEDAPGQERAVRALEFGLQTKAEGYHIYVAGPTGTGRFSLARAKAEALAAKEPVPDDWCYVHNFRKPRHPKALRFRAGVGKQFRDDMNELIETLQEEMQKVFSSESYEKEKNAVVKVFENRREELMKAMSDMAKTHGFSVRSSNAGIFFMPVVEGETINEEKYDALSDAEREAIDASSDVVQEKAAAILRDVRKEEKAAKQATDDLEYKVGMLAIGQHVNAMQAKYQDCEGVIAYLEAVQEDILEHIGDFIEPEEEEEDSLSALIPALARKDPADLTRNYRVNLLVDHGKSKGAPVIVDFNPTYYNLVGEVEYDNDSGNLSTDFMKIKGGLLHRANGGYFIVQIHELLNHPQSWEALRRALKTGELTLEGMREQLSLPAAPSLDPEPIPLNLKVILVGNAYYYELLQEYDEDFAKLFKIRADFDYEMPLNRENAARLGAFLHRLQARQNTLPLTPEAMQRIAEYATRLAERQDRLTTRLEQLKDIVTESDSWARRSGKTEISAETVEQAIREKVYRRRLYEEKLQELLDDNIMLIDTTGEKVGQINALTVLDMGDYAFGSPSRITATTYVGRAGIVNIEKESAMSGPTHNKGVHILAGYLGQTYAQKFPLSLSCQLCFEQSYNGIDGDSASSSELYCILSSLSGAPIRQELAVTGSINQWGQIQAIGGVTQKIEGFFALCKKRGLTGDQGVVIPQANCKDLVLCDEVVEAVRAGNFHIYPISHVDEGIELLMGGSAKVIHNKVMRKLKAFHDCQRPKENK